MSITLDLPAELANELSAEAARLGMPLSGYVLQILAKGRALAQVPKTGAELVEYWQREELFGSRRDIADSQARARELRAQAEVRARA